MHMLRCLFFIEAKLQFKTTAVHIPGVDNELADDLSRDQHIQFIRKKKDADANPSFIPPPLLQWLLHQEMDWTSPSWMQLFSSTVQRE